MKLNQFWTYAILTVALFAMTFGMGSTCQRQNNPFLGSIAAKVDGSEISRSEFIDTYSSYQEKAKQQNQELPPSLARSILKQLIEKELGFILRKKMAH